MGNVLWPLIFIFVGLTAFAEVWALQTILPVKEAQAKGFWLAFFKVVAWALAILVWYEGIVESIAFKLAGVPEPAAVTPAAAVAAATQAAAVIATANAAKAQAAATAAAAKAAALAPKV